MPAVILDSGSGFENVPHFVALLMPLLVAVIRPGGAVGHGDGIQGICARRTNLSPGVSDFFGGIRNDGGYPGASCGIWGMGKGILPIVR